MRYTTVYQWNGIPRCAPPPARDSARNDAGKKTRKLSFHALPLLLLILAVAIAPADAGVEATPSPPSGSAAQSEPIAVLSGGCFWGVDAVFKHVKGVTNVVSGYAGGSATTAQYEIVSTGLTGHAESVKITYDPAHVSYKDLLKVFFFVAHDPTELNYQGPDSGTQYRSAIFYTTDEQRRIAQDYITQLDSAKALPGPIVTQLGPLKGFYPAEEYHQNFLARNRDYPYIVINDLPKLERLRTTFPEMYQP
jgi:peptide-methionine (S)-S-oxide reductase